MEAILASTDEKTEDKATHVRNVCLGTPVILREILQEFSNRELIKLSLVNKQWNFEARSVLRDRGTLVARIRSSHKDLVAFASDLRRMRVVPFAGMCGLLAHKGSCNCPYKGSLHPSYNVILERLQFKKLSLDFRIDWDTCKDCPALLLVKEILKDFAGALKELSLVIPWEIVEELQQFLLNCSFPRLKILKLEKLDEDVENYTKFVKALVSRSPNLRGISGDINFNDNVLEGSSAVIVPNRVAFCPLNERVCDSLVHAVRPVSIEIRRDHREDFNPELLNRYIPRMLQASRPTLTTLRMDLLFAVPLMCYEICLENVTVLQIYLNCSLLERLSSDLLTLLKGFDSTRVLPKLSKVIIDNYQRCHFSPAQIGAFIEQGKAVLRRAVPNRAVSINKLKFHDSVSNSTVLVLAQMFPTVKTLSVVLACNTPRVPFTLLWEHFNCMEELQVEQKGLPRYVENLDSAFCGIFPEEAAELREMDDEYLKAVNIVPVMPCITCMKDLKKLRFRYCPDTHKFNKRDPTFIFSKVTGLLGFARCPHLAVAFECASSEALHHMKPYGYFNKINF